MSQMPDIQDIESFLATAAASARRPLNIAILRSVTVEGIEPYLKYFAAQAGFEAGIRFGGFDTVVQDALAAPSDLFGSALDVVMIFAPIATLSPRIASDFAAQDAGAIAAEIDRLSAMFDLVAQALRQKTGALILWQGFETPLAPSLGILDGNTDHSQIAAIARLNAQLRATLQSVRNAYAVDMDACLRKVGASDFYDARYNLIARAPYRPRGLYEIARENFKFIRGSKGMNKKCLVMDCDNTLWGGIIGEDGLSGIKIGQDYPGSAFRNLQGAAVNLYHRGIILCLCSKNNEADVWEVFASHPDMVLRREHIAASRINWSNKAENLRALAVELNIGLDSMVFMDDSEFEINLVREQVPEVAVLHLPKGRPAEYAQLLSDCGLFDSLHLSSEDRNRGEMYRADAERKRAKTDANDIGGYLRSLEMKIEFGYADAATIPRIAQQTQKTNQFNLTTRRYSDADIKGMADSNRHDVVWLRVGDKFGDLGIVGTAILSYEGEGAQIDTLLMSCRALGREIERSFLQELLRIARERGAGHVEAEYIPTAKNGQVEDFYPANGFSSLNGGEAGICRYRYDLAGYEYRPADTYTMIVNADRRVSHG